MPPPPPPPQDYFVKGDFLGKVSVPLARITAKHDEVHRRAHERLAAVRKQLAAEGRPDSADAALQELFRDDTNTERPPDDPWWREFGTDPLLFVRPGCHAVRTSPRELCRHCTTPHAAAHMCITRGHALLQDEWVPITGGTGSVHLRALFWFNVETYLPVGPYRSSLRSR